jgi:hypothetical protein
MNIFDINTVLLRQIAEDSSLWCRPEFVIFLITILTYLFGFLVYGGYLSAFAGSIGNTPFAFSDLTIVDLLAILPITIITIFNKVLHGFGDAVRFIVFYSIIPTFIGLLSRFQYWIIFSPKLASIAFLAGMILWMVVVLTVAWFNIRYKSWWFIFALLAAIASGVLFWGGAPVAGQFVNTTPPEGIYLLNSLLGIISFLFALLAAFILGIVTAETVVERKMLSIVSRLALRQPLPMLGTSEHIAIESNKGSNKKWFFKPSVSVSLEPDVYTYCYKEEHPLYLVSIFRNFSLFYIPGNLEEQKMNGRLVSISSHMIYSIELVICDRKKRNM